MTCLTCGRSFESDRSPMAGMGYCMLCRSQVDVTCSGCQAACKGAPDGLTKCQRCRHDGYMKAWVWADMTGGRLWRLQQAHVDPLRGEW